MRDEQDRPGGHGANTVSAQSGKDGFSNVHLQHFLFKYRESFKWTGALLCYGYIGLDEGAEIVDDFVLN